MVNAESNVMPQDGSGGRSEGTGSGVELAAVLVTGVLHVLIEMSVQGLRGASETIAGPHHIFNLVAVVGWGGYVVWKACRSRGFLAETGIRRAGFAASLGAGAAFTACAIPVLLAFGWMRDRLPLPATFWLLLGMYPAWGMAQQFALQGLVRRNLVALVERPAQRIVLTATIFSAAHFPNVSLMILTLMAGLVFTAIFEWKRNLWAVGLIHGILGAAAYMLVLGEDPGRQLLELL